MAESVKQIRTIEYVKPDVRSWENKSEGKTFYFAECVFENGDEGSVLTMSQEKADEVRVAMLGVKDQAVEFELIAGKPFQGHETWKIRGFPGMPELPKGGGGGGGSRGGGGMSHAQAGLLAAASALGPSFARLLDNDSALEGDSLPIAGFAADIQELGDLLTDHLFTRRKGEGNAEGGDSGGTTSGGGESSGASAPPPPTPPAEDQMRLPQRLKLREIAQSKGLDVEEMVRQTAGKEIAELTAGEADLLIEAVQ